jgi:glycine/D-amino acid oxidase-like deaminating enzyme
VRSGETSYWWASLGGAPPRRAPLPGPRECDVAIVGAGYTGLWTAYYLKRADPSLEIVVLEREHAGFGASGRNGGWVSGLLAGSRERWAAEAGREPVLAAQRAMFATVDEVAEVCEREGIDCDFVKAGSLDVARSAPALARLRERLAYHRSWGFGDDDWRETDTTAGVEGVRGAVFTPHCARVHPAKLARGLAEAVERLGVTIYEDTPVCALNRVPTRMSAHTTRGEVRARWVVRATEGFTHALAPRRLIPMNSSMIVTAPLTDAVGWDQPFTLRDAAHAFVYLQRTADDRIAIGGRGIPYRYGSRTDRNGEVSPATIAELRKRLGELWPRLEAAEIEHAWAGVLGVSRDWCPAVTAADGLATAGGYVGDGVATANLAGRTLRDLMLGRDTELTRMPWTRHVARRWEPEPLRFLGVRTVYRLYRGADTREERTQRPSRLAAVADRIAGR